MTSVYPYANVNRLENRNTYFYTPYGGEEFLDAWRNERLKALAVLPEPAKPIENGVQNIPEVGQVETAILLDSLYSAIFRNGAGEPNTREWLEKLVKKFEVTKRIHTAYDIKFRALDHTAYSDLSLYTRLAEVFEATYNKTNDLIYLNVFLKCIDTLCSVKDVLSQKDRARVAWLIKQEIIHVDAVTNVRAVR